MDNKYNLAAARMLGHHIIRETPTVLVGDYDCCRTFDLYQPHDCLAAVKKLLDHNIYIAKRDHKFILYLRANNAVLARDVSQVCCDTYEEAVGEGCLAVMVGKDEAQEKEIVVSVLSVDDSFVSCELAASNGKSVILNLHVSFFPVQPVLGMTATIKLNEIDGVKKPVVSVREVDVKEASKEYADLEALFPVAGNTNE